MRIQHVHAGIFTIFSFFGTMLLAPHIFLAIIRQSNGGSIVDQFPISGSITTLEPFDPGQVAAALLFVRYLLRSATNAMITESLSTDSSSHSPVDL